MITQLPCQETNLHCDSKNVFNKTKPKLEFFNQAKILFK